MSRIFGGLNISDTDRVRAATQGQRVLYERAVEYVNKINEEINQVYGFFVERDTEDHTIRYKLPGGGHMARKSHDGRYPSVKAYGYWDVAFPLEDFGLQVSGDDITMAYMTVQELENHILTVTAANVNTVRYELLKALFDNTQDTFSDELWGSLSIEPLANGDTVTYPPVVGSESEATEDHYLESGYASGSISDTNNPLITIKDDLVHHFGISGDGYDIAVFIHGDEEDNVSGLTDFDPVNDRFTRPGANADQVVNLPAVPGAVIGRSNGVWVVRWDWIPSGYMVGIHMDAPPPLMRRVDPADTGLGRGLQLVTKDRQFPFEASFWRHRFGFGVANRLNGVVMELASGGTYTIPTAYQ